MIGQYWQSVYEAILHICAARAIPTSRLVFSIPLEIISQSIKPSVEQLSYDLPQLFY